MQHVWRYVRTANILLIALALLAVQAPVQAQSVNIALGANPLESDPGWGGGNHPWEMVDGLTLYSDWPHGLAFTGGIASEGGQPCGWRQATLNFGTMKTFSRAMIWHHGTDHIPTIFNLLYWNGSAWLPTGGAYSVRYDLTTPPPGMAGAGSTPTEHIFAPVTGSKIRFEMNNCNINHGWIYEFEVFSDNHPPVCSGAAASDTSLWPPEHQLVQIAVTGVTDPDGDPVMITVTSIYQDEPVNGLGDGDTAPDGFGVGAALAEIRAERSGTGDGRFYYIGFTADDGRGAACTGTVEVKVNRDKGKKHAAVGGGPLYDSTSS